MPNKSTHQFLAALGVGGTLLLTGEDNEETAPRAVGGAALAGLLTNLPDKLEPALNPHHRQFFHSYAIAGGIGLTGHSLIKWKPKDDLERVLRSILLVGCGAYLIHLATDSLTSRSLPILGKL